MAVILNPPPELQIAARRQFLDAIKIHAPSVLVSLREEVFPVWEKLRDFGYYKPEYLNRDHFEPTSIKRFIKEFKKRLRCDSREEAHVLSVYLDRLAASLARFRDIPARPGPDGTVSITIRFVPNRTIVEQSHPLDKVLSILEAMSFKYTLSFTLGDRQQWEAADILQEYTQWSKLYDTVGNWLEKWHLSSPWFADCVLQTVGAWIRFRGYSMGYFEYDDHDKYIGFVPDELNWKYKVWNDIDWSKDRKRRNFTYTPWNPDVEDWKSFQKKEVEAFRGHLLNHRKETLQSLGKKKHYIARRKNADYHYQWLIDYQLNGLRGLCTKSRRLCTNPA